MVFVDAVDGMDAEDGGDAENEQQNKPSDRHRQATSSEYTSTMSRVLRQTTLTGLLTTDASLKSSARIYKKRKLKSSTKPPMDIDGDGNVSLPCPLSPESCSCGQSFDNAAAVCNHIYNALRA